MKYKYEFTKEQIETTNRNCLICNKEITDTEFEYEDYFVVFRGHGMKGKSNACFYGYLCFCCYEERNRK